MANNTRRRLGDRREGRRLRTLSPIISFTPFIMRDRSDACNYFEGTVDITETDRWLREKRRSGYKGLGMLHMFIAAYIRVVSHMPGLNRFVAGQRVYARNDITIDMMVKRSVDLESEETVAKVVFEPTDTVFDVYQKMNAAVEDIRSSDDSGTEATARTLLKLPRLLLKFAIWVIRVLDYFDLLPSALLEVSPFHGSMIITDLGSLGIPPIYHHIYNFGSVTLFFGMGTVEKVAVVEKGEARMKRFLPIGITADERVCSGAHYAAFFGTMSYLLNHPEELEKPPESVRFDEKCEYHVPKVGEQPAKKQKKQQKATVQA